MFSQGSGGSSPLIRTNPLQAVNQSAFKRVKQVVARTKRKHSVKANLQIFNLSKAGTSLELEVYAQQTRNTRRKIGTMIIGRGSMTWRRAKGHKGRRISWSRLAELMENY
jgi:hypothetical protein